MTKTKQTVASITRKLAEKKSYLRWGKNRLADRFNVAPRTMTRILNTLGEVRTSYNQKLKNQN